MDVRLADGWAESGNHDSKYDGSEVKTLVGQVRDLPGINNVNTLPDGVKAFVQKCVLGNVPVWVTKGLHERWDKIRADGVLTKEASPHLQIKFNNNPAGNAYFLTGHVFLSEDYAFTQRGWDRFGWKTVGVGVSWNGTIHQFPAVFYQEVGNIQTQDPGKRGRKRRDSIGLIVPEEFKPVPETVG